MFLFKEELGHFKNRNLINVVIVHKDNSLNRPIASILCTVVNNNINCINISVNSAFPVIKNDIGWEINKNVKKVSTLVSHCDRGRLVIFLRVIVLSLSHSSSEEPPLGSGLPFRFVYTTEYNRSKLQLIIVIFVNVLFISDDAPK